MEDFKTKSEMVAALKKRNLVLNGTLIYAQNPTEYAGEWKYKFPPPHGKEESTPVIADLIRKYQKQD